MLGKLFCAIMYSDIELYSEAVAELTKKYGPIDMESDIFDFSFTAYYEKEFGPALKKRFVAFKEPIRREELPDIKIFTCELEKKLGKDSKRTVNLDPGYVTLNNLIVASTKEFPSRIYLGKGIFGDLQLILKRDEVQLMPYTYADYKLMKDFFLKLRHLAPRQ